MDTKVVKTGPARPVQPEKPGIGTGTDPVQSKNPINCKTRDKPGRPPVEPATRMTRFQVSRFSLLFLIDFFN